MREGERLSPYSVDLVEIDEPCDHSVQFAGICANCAKDMTEYVNLPVPTWCQC